MISLTFVPTPLLTVDNETFRGINIVEKLYELKSTSDEANAMFLQAISVYQRTALPAIGLSLKHIEAVLPLKHITDVGYDLTLIAVHSQPTQLTTIYDTFVSLTIPLGYYCEIVPRSSLSKTGYMLANSVGIIDAGYTGTLKIPLIKIDPSAPSIELPARLAQLILKPYVISESYVTDDLIQTNRGEGGFGSTG